LPEVNSQPDRLDLDDTALMAAKKRGVGIVISSDAHRVEELGLVEFGVYQARHPGGERRGQHADADAAAQATQTVVAPCGETVGSRSRETSVRLNSHEFSYTNPLQARSSLIRPTGLRFAFDHGRRLT
jgi:hypothetical protein